MKKCRGSAPLAGLRQEMPSDERAHCRFSERYGALARRVFPVHGRHMSHRGGIHARQPADAHGPGPSRHRRHGRADGHRRGRFRRTHQPASFTADQGHGQATHFAGLFAAADCLKSACGPGPELLRPPGRTRPAGHLRGGLLVHGPGGHFAAGARKGSSPRAEHRVRRGFSGDHSFPAPGQLSRPSARLAQRLSAHLAAGRRHVRLAVRGHPAAAVPPRKQLQQHVRPVAAELGAGGHGRHHFQLRRLSRLFHLSQAVSGA